ncbi:biotin transporter BioY [Thermophilibacter sp.]
MSVGNVTRCGVSVALLAVSAAVSLALGPVPFTLQTLVLTLLPVAIGGRAAVISVAVYLLLGAAGLPVFSGMQGGLGVLAGPTGGFLWGFLAGEALAALVLGEDPGAAGGPRAWLAAACVLAASYVAGTVQLMAVLGVGPAAAVGSAVLPFVVPDLAKAAIGVSAGRRVRRALEAVPSAGAR